MGVKLAPLASLLSLIVVASVAAAEIKALDVKAALFHFKLYQAGPQVCKSSKQLVDSLGEKVGTRIASEVDLTTHDVVVFRWSNSGTDRFELKRPTTPGDTWVLRLIRGNTKASKADIRAYAIPHGVLWKYERTSRFKLPVLVPAAK